MVSVTKISTTTLYTPGSRPGFNNVGVNELKPEAGTVVWTLSLSTCSAPLYKVKETIHLKFTEPDELSKLIGALALTLNSW
jgi:hypothetical protein